MLAGGVLFMTSCVSSKKFKASQSEVARLHSTVDSFGKVTSDLNGQVSKLQSDNAATTKSLADCKTSSDAIAAQKAALDQSLATQSSNMEALRKSTEDALSNSGDSSMSGSSAKVTSMNGMVFVSMPDKLTYKEGSTRLSKAGAGSLESIAKVLNDNPGVSVIVVGNADTLGIDKGFKDNWSLSTERANTIVRVLRDKYKIEPSRIIAAGRSRYDPIADNATKDGRKMNRRTDIIINPDQSKLWEIVDGAKK